MTYIGFCLQLFFLFHAHAMEQSQTDPVSPIYDQVMTPSLPSKTVFCLKTEEQELSFPTDTFQIKKNNIKIMKINTAINQLSYIQILDLSHNLIASLPQALGKLFLLKHLLLRNNVLKELPKTIFKTLGRLEILDISDNCLGKICEGQTAKTIKIFSEILGPKLKTLNFSNNNLRHSQIDEAIFAAHGQPLFSKKNKFIRSILPLKHDVLGLEETTDENAEEQEKIEENFVDLENFLLISV